MADQPKYARTAKQAERQHADHRSNGGQYAKMNPCEMCGKGTGASFFTSDHHDKMPGGEGQVLHESCARKLDAMPLPEARNALKAAAKKLAKPSSAKENAGKDKPQRPPPTERMKQIDDEIDAHHRTVMTGVDGSPEIWNAKMKIMELRGERSKIWKEQTAHVDTRTANRWAKEADEERELQKTREKLRARDAAAGVKAWAAGSSPATGGGSDEFNRDDQGRFAPK